VVSSRGVLAFSIFAKKKKVSITSTATNFLLFSRCVTPRRSCCIIYLLHHLAAQAEVISIISHSDVCLGKKNFSLAYLCKVENCRSADGKERKNLQKRSSCAKNKIDSRSTERFFLLLAATNVSYQQLIGLSPL
jgi:hypothetical protein